MLAGLGNTAHVFDHFAYQFTDQYRVIAITRRGFGASSHPTNGYDLATRAGDIAAVLDHLKIERAILVGHSLTPTRRSRSSRRISHECGTGAPQRPKRTTHGQWHRMDALER